MPKVPASVESNANRLIKQTGPKGVAASAIVGLFAFGFHKLAKGVVDKYERDNANNNDPRRVTNMAILK